jgi:hypothetical protein
MSDRSHSSSGDSKSSTLIAYRRPRWDQVSVARRQAVAALDVRVGPKT